MANTDQNMQPQEFIMAPATKPDIFFTIPPELRDMVYELVYGDAGEVKLLQKRDWETKERNRRKEEREHFKPKCFPESCFSHLIVNKQYFEEATQVWIRRKTFRFDEEGALMFFACSDDPVLQFMLPLIRNIEVNDALRIPRIWEERGDRLPGLRVLSVRIDISIMMALGDSLKTPWLDSYTDIELADFAEFKTLLVNFRALDTLQLRWRDSASVGTPDQQAKLAAFKTQVQTLLDDVVTQPREEGHVHRKAFTFADALRAINDTVEYNSRSSTPASLPDIDPLLGEKLPTTQGDLLRLCLTRPEALLDWMHDAAEKMKG